MNSRKHVIRRSAAIAVAGLFLLLNALRPESVFRNMAEGRQQLAMVSLMLFGSLFLVQAFLLLRRLAPASRK